MSRDPRIDPQPGDAVEWEYFAFHVLNRVGDTIYLHRQDSRTNQICGMYVALSAWRAAHRMFGSEVMHVAPGGTEV